MSTIKLPVRYEVCYHLQTLDEGWMILGADGRKIGPVESEKDAAQIVAALNRPDLAPALAALEAVAREALREAEIAAGYAARSKMEYRGEKGETAADKRDRIKAALALAGATRDGKAVKP